MPDVFYYLHNVFKSGVFHKLRERINSNFTWNNYSNNYLEVILEIIPDEKVVRWHRFLSLPERENISLQQCPAGIILHSAIFQK